MTTCFLALRPLRFSAPASTNIWNITSRFYQQDPRSKLHPRDPRRKIHPRDPRLKEVINDDSGGPKDFEKEMSGAAAKVVDKWGGDPHKLDVKDKEQMEEEINAEVHKKRIELVKDHQKNVNNGDYRFIERHID